MLTRTPVLTCGVAALCTSLLLGTTVTAQDNSKPTGVEVKQGELDVQQQDRPVRRTDTSIRGIGTHDGGVAGAVGCPADSLFGQDPTDPAGAWTFGVADSDWDAAGAGLQRWESFSGVGGDICSMTWWGVRAFFDGAGFVECAENPMAFDITFHPDVAGLPGAATCSYSVSVTGTPTGVLFAGFEMYEYTVDLTSNGGCCTMSDGWVSIYAGGDDPTCWFLWSSHGDTGSGSSLADLNDGAGIITDDFDLAFCLQGVPVPGACCMADGTCVDGVFIGDCLACGDTFFQDMLCADITCAPYVGACCLPDFTCIETSPDDCAAQGGSIFCDGETCADVNCLQPACGVPGTGDCYVANGSPFCEDGECCDLICAADPFCCDTEWDQICADAALADCPGAPAQACCFSDGTCQDLSPSDCATAGGTSLGVGTDCASSSCDGACCFGDGTCTDGTEADCDTAGGSFQGEGTDCASTTCPFGACCLDGVCTSSHPDDCAASGGIYFGDGSTCDGAKGEGPGVDCTPPANDDCETAEPLDLGVSAFGNTTLAGNDETPFCGTSTPFNGVWYVVTGTGNTMLASTCNPGSDFDTKLQVFCSCEDLLCVGGNDDAVGAPPECDLNGLNRFSQVSWCSAKGQTYYIKVGGFSTSVGNFELTVTDDGTPCDPAVSCEPPVGRCCYEAPCPADCADGGDGMVGVTDLLALLAQWGGPGSCDLDGGGVGVTDLLALLAAWGDCPDGACEVNTLGECTALGGEWTEGIDCTTECPVPLSNDECGDRIDIGPGSYSFDTTDATNSDDTELDIICDEGFGLFLGADIWYTYTPAESGMAEISLCTSGYDTRMAVYNNVCPPTNADLIACDDDGCGTIGGPSTVTIAVKAGSPVLIRVGGWMSAGGGTAASGAGTMDITETPDP